MVDTQIVVKAVLLVAVVVIALLSAAPGASRRTAIRRILTVLFAIAAAVAIVLPDLTTTVAQAIGIGRGADLLLYGLVIAFLAQVVRSRLERERMRRQITDLARAIALREVAGRVAADLPALIRGDRADRGGQNPNRVEGCSW